MAEEKIRLGGMALANGVLVHGPTAWACAVRLDEGELKVASGPKRFRAGRLDRPLLRGPARLLEAVAVVPEVRRAIPEARLPFQRPAVLASMLASAVVVRVAREAGRLGPAAQALGAGLLSVAPASLALRSWELAASLGAGHISHRSSSICRSRRCAPGTTPTRTSTTRVRRCLQMNGVRVS